MSPELGRDDEERRKLVRGENDWPRDATERRKPIRCQNDASAGAEYCDDCGAHHKTNPH